MDNAKRRVVLAEGGERVVATLNLCPVLCAVLALGVAGCCLALPSDKKKEEEKTTEPTAAPPTTPAPPAKAAAPAAPAAPAPAPAAAAPAPAAPAAQPWAGLLDGLQGFKGRYGEAGNEVKKSGVFNEARAFEREFFAKTKNRITDWQSKVDRLKTTKGGEELWLGVKVGKGERLFGGFEFAVTFEQGFGLGDEGIKPDSPVYKAAGDLGEKACVVFSGKVTPKEKSISESGGMDSPEYAIEFTSLKPCAK